jgi:Ca-activated chloride channel family protein
MTDAPQPRLTCRTDRTLIRAGGRSERFILVELEAPSVPRDPSRRRPPVNLAFVLDRSGSMQARGKLDLARQAVDEALARLDPEDRFSVVVYNDQVDVVAPSHRASEKARRKASEALVSIEARGSTDLAGGWLTGCDQVAQHLVESGVNRCLLLTDGLANVGIVDPAELERHAGELRARGVATSTFGVGEDFNEALLQSMADAGGGHFFFAASVVEIRDHITSEVGETLDVVARDVTLEVTAPETVTIESMAPFRTEARGSRTLIRIGDLVSGQVVRIVLRVTFPFGEVGREIGALVGVTDRDEVFRGAEPALAPVAVAWRYADHPANDAQPRDRGVDRAVAQIFAARARQEAVQLNRAGDYAAAQAALAGVAKRVRSYASGDAELREIAASLRMELPTYAAAMPEMARKSRHWAASNVARMRTAEGQSVRRPKA